MIQADIWMNSDNIVDIYKLNVNSSSTKTPVCIFICSSYWYLTGAKCLTFHCTVSIVCHSIKTSTGLTGCPWIKMILNSGRPQMSPSGLTSGWWVCWWCMSWRICRLWCTDADWWCRLMMQTVGWWICRLQYSCWCVQTTRWWNCRQWCRIEW